MFFVFLWSGNASWRNASKMKQLFLSVLKYVDAGKNALRSSHGSGMLGNQNNTYYKIEVFSVSVYCEPWR